MVKSLVERLKFGLLIPTSEECVLLDKASPGVLTLVWDGGIDVHASDYFRYLHLRPSLVDGSIGEYAKIIRHFLAYVRSRNVKVERMTDAFLTEWRDWMKSRPGVKGNRVNACLAQIFNFLKWLEETGRIRYVVGIYAPGSLSDRPADYQFPISAERRIVEDSNGRSRVIWTTDLYLSGEDIRKASRHTPVEDEIRRIHAAAIVQRHGVRNTLMFSWAEETGARRADVIQIDTSQIPSVDELCKYHELDEQICVSVIRKGRKVATMIYPTIDLLIRTRDYIDIDRAIVVKRKGEDVPGYVEPTALFLSGTTGQRLTADALTRLSYEAFAKADIANSSFHRFRARFALNTLDALLDSIFTQDDIPNIGSWEETIVTKLAELMGHASVQSLRPYIQFALHKRLKTTASARAVEAEVRLRNAELAFEALNVKAGANKLLYLLGQAIKTNADPVERQRIYEELGRDLERMAA